MADDIEDLLNRIEYGPGSKFTEDGVRLEMLSDVYPYWRNSNKNIGKELGSTKTDPSSSENAGKNGVTVRCHEAFVGGSTAEPGCSTLFAVKPCSSLRCTACDFLVSHFDDFQWDKSVDYLFLRNNMPDFSKVKTMLKKKYGCRAYACQCTWLDSYDVELLKSVHSSVKWVCGKH